MPWETSHVKYLLLVILVNTALLHGMYAPTTKPKTKQEDQIERLNKIRNRLYGANDMDILFLIDVSSGTRDYVKSFAGLSIRARSCFKNMRSNNNQIAMITFGNTSKLEYGFHDCMESACLERVSKSVTQRNESRKINIGLRHAKRLLKSEKQKFEKQHNSTYPRNQTILLVTFGVGLHEKKFPMASRIFNHGIHLIVMGLGVDAEKNENILTRIVQPSTKKKESSTDKGIVLVTPHVEYIYSMLELAITFSCF